MPTIIICNKYVLANKFETMCRMYANPVASPYQSIFVALYRDVPVYISTSVGKENTASYMEVAEV